MNNENPSAINIGRLVIGINVLLVGLYVLFCNFGWINFGYFPYFWKLWPVIFIIIGLNIIFSREGINYIGSLAFTILLIILLVASSPGASGTATRAALRIPEEPKTISLSSIGDLFDFGNLGWHGSVKQTVAGSFQLDHFSFPIGGFEFNIDDNHAEKVEIVLIPSTEKQRIDYEIGIKTDKDIDKKQELGIELVDDYKINIIEIKEANFFYDAKIKVYYDSSASITTKGKLYDFEIAGDWVGNLDITNLKSGDFNARNLEGSNTISTISGDISCDDVKNSTFKATSGNLEVGNAKNTNLSTVSGNIECKSNSGNFDINATSGNISISSISEPGNAKVKSVSGEIEIDNYFATSGNITISTTSGNVDIVLSSNPDNSIKGGIATTSGSISGNGPGLDIKNRNFTIGDSNSGMMIRTTSGDISLTRME